MEDLLIRAANLGVKFRLEGDELRVTAPRGALTQELQQDIRQHKQALLDLLRARETPTEALPLLESSISPPADRWEPFPLSDLQHAYWVGRDSSMVMGSVATHLYVELDCKDLDLEQLNKALRRMIARHDMLRAVIDRNGMQRILQTVPEFVIPVNDQSQADAEAVENAVLTTRNELSHQVLAADRWPLFDVRATQTSANQCRLHVSLDLLILDAWSIFLFFSEWHRFYSDSNYNPAPLTISFRDYAIAEQSWKTSRSYMNSYAYWMRRVDELPPAPELPLRPFLEGDSAPRFSRREARIPAATWQQLKSRARERGITPSSLLLAAYSEVLARWSKLPHFSVNVTVSNRMPLHPEINQLIGDFTTPMLQEIDRRDHNLGFGEFAARLQRQFAQDMQHLQVSGVIVLREWAKRRGVSAQAAMPVVFSSGLIWSGDQEPGDLEQFGKKVSSVSQTSQVWLDHHVMELQGDLSFVWDAVDAMFEPGVLDNMFAAYCQLVRSLAESDIAWDNKDPVALPAKTLDQRISDHCTHSSWQARHLHAGFVKQYQSNPQATALIYGDQQMTYGALLSSAAGIADRLREQGLQAGQPVAVVMHKGWEQIAAVLGVLLAGGAYMPIDANLPAKRQSDLLSIGDVSCVLVQPNSLNTDLSVTNYHVIVVSPEVTAELQPHHLESLQAPLDQLAYVIFTSGTTGIPKGVMISHRAAMNTIEHINRILQVTPADRVLAVSSLSFDLSVYDIFGMLDAGAALVIPSAHKGHDPVHWLELITNHGVTLWNSAPQLMGMLMDAVDQPHSLPLAAVLLSGDFIALDLPGRVKQAAPGARFISLGGATEASIWSNYFEVLALDPQWKSIPYGKALPNQTMQVFDQAFRPCPDYAKGKIYIGGEGLAIAYWKDAEKTAARFVTHSVSGERLYDTGDLGYYLPSGDIVIIGRDDAQVKIRGHRIELGEIEAAIRTYPGVKQVVVIATAPASGSRQLIAYLEPEKEHVLEVDQVKAHIAQRLPDYMVPRYMVTLARLPVTANGKLDHRALPDISELLDEQAAQRVLARSPLEQTLLETWGKIISGVELGVTDNFFELGGDSVMATSLVRELNLSLPGFNLEMHELFENLTIEALAQLYVSRQSGVPEKAANSLIDDALAQSDMDELRARINQLPMDAPPADPTSGVLLTGATGWVGTHVLAELLTTTTNLVYCLVRAESKIEGLARIVGSLASIGFYPDDQQHSRIAVLCGDITLPQFGLNDGEWSQLSQGTGRIFHLAANLSLVTDYAGHRQINLLPLLEVARLASTDYKKQVCGLTPMTSCRRQQGDSVVCHYEEQPLNESKGLLTGYAQSKWAAEQVLLHLAQSGVPVNIFRTSHALPNAKNGLAKPGDTYTSVMKIAQATGVIPEWEDSAIQGLPVDRLAQLLVSLSSAYPAHTGPIHLENANPSSIPDFIRASCGPVLPSLSLDQWQDLALQKLDMLAPDEALMIRVLFANRAAGAAIHHMFSRTPVDIGFLQHLDARETTETPSSYWKNVANNWRLSTKEPM